MNGYVAVIWLVVAAMLFWVEAATYQLVCIWFAVGALGAMIAALFGASVTVQLVVFLVVSIAVLVFVRPIVREKIKFRKSATNADALIGKTGVVIHTIDNVVPSGRIVINGLDWAACSSEEGVVIQENARVRVLRIDGVKLVVEPVDWVEVQVEKE